MTASRRPLSRHRSPNGRGAAGLRVAPLTQALSVALLAAAGGTFAGTAHAQQAFSPAWFADKAAIQSQAAATGRLPDGRPAHLVTGPQRQSQAARETLDTSIANLGAAAQAIALQQGLQQQARRAAQARPSSVPDGLGEGGLKVDDDALTAGWHNARGPVQSERDGKVVVDIEQTGDRAILNWETFNVGRNTTVNFDQDASWSVLNRINDPNARPSQIQGQIHADGTVLLVNRNGVVFDGSSQVNVRNLAVAAAAIGDSQFQDNGLYNGGNPVFTGAAGAVRVEAGARIQTHTPKTVTQGGGYVLLAGHEVSNAGTVVTPNGQTVLAAGDSFAIVRGQGTEGNQASTTRGNQVTATVAAGSEAGTVVNSGLIQAATGDISLIGRDVRQAGVALASTSQAARGTVHLTAVGADGRVTLGEGGTTAILLEDTDATALDSQRDSLLAPVVDTSDDPIVPADAYRRDQSLVEIRSGGAVDFESGSLTLATGGQVAVDAGTRALVREGATIDVSGAVGVKVAMEANSVRVNIQGNELRDSSVNRDSAADTDDSGSHLNSNNVWVDVRDLVYVPAGTNGYASDRWYTAGGLLEVGGYLGTQGRGVGEWMAQGGSVRFTGGDVVTRQGSQINLSGGTLDVQSGLVRQSWLKGADGQLYEVSKAPGDVLYTGVYRGFEDSSARWGVTDYHVNPLIAPQGRLENGYTVGRDAGTLVIGTRNAVLEGDIVGDTFQGERQVQAPQAGLDGYAQSQTAAARGAQLVVGQVTPYYDKDSGTLQYNLTANAGTVQDVVLAGSVEKIAAGLDLDSVLPDDRQRTLQLDTDQLDGFGLGAVRIAATGGITVDDALTVGPAGEIILYGPQVAVNADLTSHGGTIRLGNVLHQVGGEGGNARIEDRTLPAAPGASAAVTVADGVTLDASGLWSNRLLAPEDSARLPYLDGGRVSVRSSGDVSLGAGSLVDVSSGAAILADGRQQGGRGGDVTLEANANTGGGAGRLVLDGDLHGHGVAGGGTLALRAGRVVIGADAADVPDDDAGTLHLDAGFFAKGFSDYRVTGDRGLAVADGAQVDVTLPVYRFAPDARNVAPGDEPSAALELWTPPLYQEDPLAARLTPRGGAGLALHAGTTQSPLADRAGVQAVIGRGAEINVDPGQAIEVRSIGQLTVDGTLNAWGGRIELGAVPALVDAAGHGRSVWIGEEAVLDVGGRAATAVDALGNRYGRVDAGGEIVIGGAFDHASGQASAADLFVVVREGALLEASGARAVLDIPGRGAVDVASAGGDITLASGNGLYVDGTLRAAAGGAGAAGGHLTLALDTPLYRTADAGDRVRQARELVLAQEHGGSALAAGLDAGAAADLLAYGHGRLGADRVEAGGFGQLTLASDGVLGFEGDVSLAMDQSLNLYARVLGLADAAPDDARVQLAAPYMRLAGYGGAAGQDNHIHPTVAGGAASVSTRAPGGALQMQAGALLEVRDTVNIGGHAAANPTGNGLPEAVDRRGFDSVELASGGDLRFLAATQANSSTWLYAPGDLTLAAAQIHPDTHASATVYAGWQGESSDFAPDRVLTLARTTEDAPATPYSAFGSLTLAAATIDQGGILRAPLGALRLGLWSGATRATRSVNLLDGSLTSASAAGLVMPYGGTSDGVGWWHDGDQLRLHGLGAAAAGSVTLTGQSVDVREGATIDLSGGGELTGAGFVSGRGGSTDARHHPLVQVGRDGFILPGLESNPVYAIVPGAQAPAAPGNGERGATDPLLGQQITLGDGVPGLPAGTYTLMPSTYALLPGAFRVELNGRATPGATTAAAAMRNGSWAASGTLSVAGTDIRDSLARSLFLTPADTLRTYSQYNETSYAQFAQADAARLGVPRAMLPVDGKSLRLEPVTGAGSEAFRFRGTVDFDAGEGGHVGSAAVRNPDSGAQFEILAAGQAATEGFAGISLYDDDLNALAAGRLTIGAWPQVTYGQQGNFLTFDSSARTHSITLREGAELRAAEVLLVTGQQAGAITIEAGAGISTLGMGDTPFDAGDGFVYTPQTGGASGGSMLAVSNGQLEVLASDPSIATQGAILIGACGTGGACDAPATLYSEGTIAFATTNRFELGEHARYGTRNLLLAVGAANLGTEAALAAAQAEGVLPSGLTLNQDVLDRLLQGDTSTGAPALERLTLNARQAVNVFGTVTLDTYDAAGRSRIDTLVFGTPALYGAGDADDVATIRTGHLVWRGAAEAPGAMVTGGAGSGSGTLAVDAETITFGYGPNVQVSGLEDADRLALGFSHVHLQASERITANQAGSLAVYRSHEAYVPGEGDRYSGGDLTLATPLLTGEAGSVNRFTAGGDLVVAAPAGAQAATLTGAESLGAEIALDGRNVRLDTAVALPSGRLTVRAADDIVLGDAAHLDLAGRAVDFDDVTRYSWGGEVILESEAGDILQSSASSIDLSAAHNHAGRLTAAALGAGAGVVDLQGRILGATEGEYDAGGTLVPYRAGFVDVRAQRLGDSGSLDEQFAALNARLNTGGMHGGRGFQLKQGDLTIGDGLDAGEVNISLDGGHLTVAGTIDASGAEVGSIRLAGAEGLTLAGGAVLDAHGERLRVDSHGKIIDSPNRAMVELNSGDGTLTLAEGSRIDLRHGTAAVAGGAPGQHDGAARGTLELNAPRLGGATAGDIAIDAGGRIVIDGARSIAVNAVQRYDDAAYGTDPAASGRPYQVIDQAYLDAKHVESTAFIEAALGNAALMDGRLAGLNNASYRDAFHLRPGVEIVSATADGDVVVQGDLDLSGHRYAGVNPHAQRTDAYGSGEVGALTVRAGGNLDIYGSINDGFAPPPETPDDDGWMLRPGNLSFGGDVIVPNGGVTLADGTRYPAGRALNYDLPVKAMTVPAGTRLPADAVLDAAVTLPADTILSGDVRASDGSLLHAAGTRLAEVVTLPAGTRVGAGFVAPAGLSLQAMLWPQGVALPVAATLDGSLALPLGGLIPSRAFLVLPDDAVSVPLRPADADGRQGANWAVAGMLPAGSQSWSMRLVAGADTRAADTRAVRPRDANGHLTLADTHVSAIDRHETIVIPGQPPQPGGAWYWNEYGVFFGFEPGTPVPEEFQSYCADGYCDRVQYVWNEYGVFFGFEPGTPVSESDLSYCPDYCVSLGEPIPGTPDEVIIGDVIERNPLNPVFSVVRTGTGDLDLVAGGSIGMRSAYGVYTAGTQSQDMDAAFGRPRTPLADGSVLGPHAGAYEPLVDGADSPWQAWYPEQGGNLLLRAGGDLTGDAWTTGNPNGAEGNRHQQKSSADPANWLWRQGDAADDGGHGAAWWINFGTYVAGGAPDVVDDLNRMPYLVGFTGYGTLGGGDLRVEARGDAGIVDIRSPQPTDGLFPRSQGLVLAVASTGRVGADGALRLTGGGDLDMRIGGALNPERAAYMPRGEFQNLGLNGLAANLRGHAEIHAAQQGGIELRHGAFSNLQDAKESRAYDPFTSTSALPGGGLMLMPGDATFSLTARGDLVLGGVRDGGRVDAIDPNAGTLPWFTLWSDDTAIDLFSAGGHLTPSTQLGQVVGNGPHADTGATAGRFIYPATLRAAAPAGSVYVGTSAVRNLGQQAGMALSHSLMLAPSPVGQLEILAGGSIYAGGYAVTRSSADTAVMPTPFNPATLGNLDPLAFQAGNNLFAFGPNTASGRYDLAPARFYALSGDIVGLRTGELLTFTSGALSGTTLYEAGGPVWMQAGRDIVNSGTHLGAHTALPSGLGSSGRSTGNLIVHTAETDVSVVSAGRDILFSSFDVAGPGTLEISAGRNIVMTGQVGQTSTGQPVHGEAAIRSLGPIVPGDTRAGADLVVQAGLGERGADWRGFLDLYLDPANQADVTSGLPLADQPGKVARTYGAELVDWLGERYGFAPSTDGAAGDGAAVDEARAYFAALPAEQQRIFARRVYFAELRAGGREYNDVDGPRLGSYLRGREAIATLFPTEDADGQAIGYAGDVLMYGGSGLRTEAGGGIQVLTPGGAQTYGVDGEVPPSTAGVVTQGQGDIQMYGRDSILLGLSRIMTTFGGDILAWSAEGDINAGRGSQTTVVYTPPRRAYDDVGNVTLSPQVPGTGAGIATLNPIAEVEPGDVDLIAPLGTIDAGEAGIRVSGNVNLAALHVVNADNIQVQGEAAGIPVAAAVNVSALTAASAAASSATQAAQDMVRQQTRQARPSIISVEVLGFGEPTGSTGAARDPLQQHARYDPDSAFQFLGRDEQAGRLTETERRRLEAQ